MKIYVGHSSGIDFREDLYRTLRESSLNENHEIVLPHENSDELFDSKSFLREEADLMVAEVSRASTGLGIELGWADLFDVPVICLYRKASQPSSSIKAVTGNMASYENTEDLVDKIGKAIS